MNNYMDRLGYLNSKFDIKSRQPNSINMLLVIFGGWSMDIKRDKIQWQLSEYNFLFDEQFSEYN